MCVCVSEYFRTCFPVCLVCLCVHLFVCECVRTRVPELRVCTGRPANKLQWLVEAGVLQEGVKLCGEATKRCACIYLSRLYCYQRKQSFMNESH